ncbi:hypothetical protein K439DRAFT_688274 [Ramaria rubella]|nr:hypothetical protein K439DRAFT_688274 [Ramaria rubella]
MPVNATLSQPLNLFNFDAFTIQSSGVQLMLGLPDTNGDPGTPVIMATSNPSDESQKWIILDEGNGLSFQSADPNRNVFVPSLTSGGLFQASRYQKTVFFFQVPGDDRSQFQITSEPNGGFAWQAVDLGETVMLAAINTSEPNQFWSFEGVQLD